MKTLKEPFQREQRNVRSCLEVVDVATGERQTLATFDGLMEAPNWTSDGKELVYNSGGRIWRFELASGQSHVVESGYVNHCNNDHVLSPDPANTSIAVSHHTAEDGQSRIYILPRDGWGGGRDRGTGQDTGHGLRDNSAPVLVTPLAPSYLHGWSPDGRTLAYCAERDGAYDIYTIPVEGGVETRLTTSAGLNDGPEYSPDGVYIWFNSVRTGLMQIWRMKADGSDQTQMTFDEANNWFPHVSPDGSTVAFISYRKGDVDPGDHPANKEVAIRLMDSAGGDPRTLVSLFGGQGTLNVNSWSPDSRKLAFVSYELK